MRVFHPLLFFFISVQSIEIHHGNEEKSNCLKAQREFPEGEKGNTVR